MENLKIALGKSQGTGDLHKFGANAIVGTTEYPIWDKGTAYHWLVAASKLQLVSTDAADRGEGNGVLTLSANVSNNDTVTIGSKIYKFQTTLTNVDGNVKIGAAATNSIDNLIAAINLSGGPNYAAQTTANPISTIAAAGAGDTMGLRAVTTDTVATTETSATASWGAATVTRGAGAWKMIIYGLDANWNEQQETVILNGTTVVQTVNTFIRCFRAKVTEAADINGLDGSVNIYKTGSASDIVAQVKTGVNQTHMVIYTVPLRKKLAVQQYDCNAGEGKDAIIKLNIRENITGNECLLTKETRYVFENSVEVLYKYPLIFPAKTDIWMTAVSSAATTPVSATFEALLIDD